MEITFIQQNDTHGCLDSHTEFFWDDPRPSYISCGGFSRIARYVNRLKQQQPNVIFVDGGDLFHGTAPLVLSRGEALLPLLKQMPLDALVPGNWDYAYGTNQLFSLIKIRPTFDDLLYAFLLDCKHRNLSRRTIEHYEYSLQQMKKSFLEQNQTLDLFSVSFQDLQAYFVGAMINKALAPHTINGRLKSCKAFFSFLFKHDYLPLNVAESLALVKAPKDTIHTFTHDQILQLLQMPNQKTFTGLRDYTIMIVLLETGIRIGNYLL